MPIIKKKIKEKPQNSPDLDAITRLLEKVKGEKGDIGPTGKDGISPNSQEIAKTLESNSMFISRLKGERGDDGLDGMDGEDGSDGKDGKDGKDGRDGRDGRDGVDGKDGSPDSAKEIIKKISGVIGIGDVKNLEDALNRRGNVPNQMIGAPRIPVKLEGTQLPTPLGSLNVNVGSSGAVFSAAPGTQDYTLDLSSITGGGGSSSSYLYTQASPSATWVIVHGLNDSQPFVNVFSPIDEIIEPQSITIDSPNQVTIVFGSAITGVAKILASTTVTPTSSTFITTTASTNATAGNYVRGDASAGDITISLVTPVQGGIVNIKKIDSSENSVFVYSTDLIDGADTAELSTEYESIMLVYTGTTYDII